MIATRKMGFLDFAKLANILSELLYNQTNFALFWNEVLLSGKSLIISYNSYWFPVSEF